MAKIGTEIKLTLKPFNYRSAVGIALVWFINRWLPMRWKVIANG